jgi:hypothetical protein
VTRFPVRSVTPLIVAAIGAFAALRSVGYVAGLGVARHRAETAWLWFGITAALAAVVLSIRAPAETRRRFLPLSWLPAFLGFALLVYWPALDVGLLSDDFVLLRWAGEGEWIPREWPYVRIIPLLVWRTAEWVAGAAHVALALHLINVLVHGANGWLVGRLACALGAERSLGSGSALLFIAYPTTVEAAVWASAMPDVLVTTFVLIALVTALTAERATLALIVAASCGAAALITKENAIAIGPLLLSSALVAPVAARRRLVTTGLAACAITALYLAWRIASGLLEEAVAPPVDRLAIKNFITGPFAVLGLPAHQLAIDAARWAWTAWTAALAGIAATAAFVWRRDAQTARTALWGAAWILVALAPTFGFFAVTSDLQGTRYLYLSTVAWCVAPAIHFRAPGRAFSAAAILVLAGAIALCATTTRRHLVPWRDAAAVRDRVLHASNRLGAGCRQAYVSGVPDNVAGAYVFRNGLTEALQRERGRSIEIRPLPDDVPVECHLDLSTRPPG